MTDDVADVQGEVAVGKLERVVPVSADLQALASREVARGQREATDGGESLGQEPALERLRDAPVPFVEASTLERHRPFAAERRQECQVVLIEAAGGRERDRERPENASRRLDGNVGTHGHARLSIADSEIGILRHILRRCQDDGPACAHHLVPGKAKRPREGAPRIDDLVRDAGERDHLNRLAAVVRDRQAAAVGGEGCPRGLHDDRTDRERVGRLRDGRCHLVDPGQALLCPLALGDVDADPRKTTYMASRIALHPASRDEPAHPADRVHDPELLVPLVAGREQLADQDVHAPTVLRVNRIEPKLHSWALWRARSRRGLDTRATSTSDPPVPSPYPGSRSALGEREPLVGFAKLVLDALAIGYVGRADDHADHVVLGVAQRALPRDVRP